MWCDGRVEERRGRKGESLVAGIMKKRKKYVGPYIEELKENSNPSCSCGLG